MTLATLLASGPMLLLLPLLLLLAQTGRPAAAQGISIRPADFERYIMPCYTGAGLNGAGGGAGYGAYYSAPGAASASFYSPGGGGVGGGGAYSAAQSPAPLASGNPASGASGAQFGRAQANGQYGARDSGFYGNSGGGADSGRLGAANQQPQTSYLGSSAPGGQLAGAGAFASAGAGQLGQSMPRANTIDNFIALVAKIEVAAPRLANNPEQLIRTLLGRFHLDNYYYDARARTSIVDQDRRYSDIVPALLNGAAGGSGSMNMNMNMNAYAGGDGFPELALDQNERCSMYFMLSHFIDKSAALQTAPGSSSSSAYLGGASSLAQLPVQQLGGPQYGQRPPSLQAAGAGYPGQSASVAYAQGNAAGQRPPFPGPAPSFGSPATANMNAFGAGLSNTNPEYAGRSPYGVNTPNAAPYNSLLGNTQLRNPNALFPGGAGPLRPPIVDASAASASVASQGGRGQSGVMSRANGQPDGGALEFGVVALAGQDNAALVLNRVLLGLLAASAPAQTIRQLASAIYPARDITQTPKLDEEIDPLFAVTLADLWAIGAIPKSGKPFDVRQLGDNGRWNDTMCPTSFALERSNSIKFTTAELLGGLDGFNLGQLRRRLLSMRRNLKLSELLRIYYSRNGFRPQLAEFGVCSRATGLMMQMDELHRQAENYLRLYQLASPISDNEISNSIARLDYFRDYARQVVQQYAPNDLCQDSSSSSSSGSDFYPTPNSPDQCEVSRADLVAVLDASPQANAPFMQLVVVKLAQRLGLSRDTNSLTILTNQQDSTGYAGAYSFNAILRNSTNLAEVGCALAHDTSQTYQGGQVSEPTRLMEMFERALINLDSEYLTRAQQQLGGGALSTSVFAQNGNARPAFVSTWFNGQGQEAAAGAYALSGGLSAGGPRNTGGAKVLVWFNYGRQLARPAGLASGPTNWAPAFGSGSGSGSDQEYRFYEAKKYLRENFRSASILAVTPQRDEVKPFVYDEERDIFGDIPAGLNALDSSGVAASQTGADYYAPSQDFQSSAALSGPAEALAGKLLARMCTIPALFQYPMCFRAPSSNELSVGYISPGRKQYWLMSPKSFFASRAIRLAFRVEGGRLRVCFGRQPNPDETALRNQQLNPGQSAAAISFSNQAAADYQQRQQQQQQLAGGGGGMERASTTPAPPQSSSGDYYTGLEFGVCKDVAPGQEVDFMISDPCWRKSIAECEPFYFVLRELSQPGEGDPNYMCRDAGCKRFDQAKFHMTHTGVSCSAAARATAPLASLPLLVLMISLLVAWLGSAPGSAAGSARKIRAEDVASFPSGQEDEQKTKAKRRLTHNKNYNCRPRLARLAAQAAGLLALACAALATLARAQQQAGVYDFGQNRYGEKRGNWTPSEWLAVILIVMLNLAGLALAIGLCFYVTKRAKQRAGLAPVPQHDY